MGETHAAAGAPQDSDLSCQATCAHEKSLQIQLVSMEGPLLPAAQPGIPAMGTSSSRTVTHWPLFHCGVLTPSVF